MSNGDDPADASEEADADDPEPDGESAPIAPSLPDEATEESLTAYLDDIETALESAETEADLDDVEALLAAAEDRLGDADLPEPDEDAEDAEDPRGDLEARIETLRAGVTDARGPYAADVVDAIESAVDTVTDTEWTAAGREDAADAVEVFVDDVAVAIETDATVAIETDATDGDGIESLSDALSAVADAVDGAGLDPDDDADTIAELIDATDALADALEASEEWDDLETHEQLRAQGYYDVLGHYKDFPVEWSALKEHESRGNVDMVLLALDSLQSDFMERHCLEALERMGKRGKTDESVEEMLGRAGKRDRFAIRILGKMAAEEAVETLLEYVEEDSNPQLQKTTFKALGEIGAAEAVGALANQLDPDGDTAELVRPHAARALGLIGDTRAIDPLADVLAEDDSDDVRAAAGWALRQIGTRDALAAVADYADERSFIVQTEGDKARETLDAAATPA